MMAPAGLDGKPKNSIIRKRQACRWMIVAILLTGCWLCNGKEPNFCGRVAVPSWGATVTYGGRSLPGRLPRSVDRSADGEARRLTSQITKAGSASKLLALVDKPVQDGKLFNDFHMSAAWTTFARFKKRRQFRKADARSPVWAKLSARLHKMLQDDLLPPRGAANVFYSVGELYAELDRHMTQVLPKLCRAVRAKTGGMKAQEISNCMLGAVSLQDASPEVLDAVPALAHRIPHKVEEMKTQAISNCLWAAANLQDASPEVLDAVPALAHRIPDKVEEMIPQHLSNCLWAAANLQDASPEVLDAVPTLAHRIPDKVEEMIPQAISNCLWAAAKLQDASPGVLDAVPALAKRIPDKVQHMNPQAISNCLWAAAKLQDASPTVLDAVPALAKRIPDKVKDMIQKQLKMALWASQQLQKPELVAKLQAKLDRRQH